MRKNIALLGAGRWGQFILRDLKSLGANVTVITRSNGRKLSDLKNMDGYVVATPSTSHAKMINKILDHDPQAKIFTEKPLATNLADAKKIYRRAPNQVFVMDKWRYHAGVQALKKIYRSREFGKLTFMKLTRAGWGNPHDDTDVIWHLLPHDISIAYEILGEFSVPKSAVADVAIGTPTGLFGELKAKPSWVHVEVSSRFPDRTRQIRLFFERAIVTLGSAYDNRIEIAKWSNQRKKNHTLGQRDKVKLNFRKIPVTMPLEEELKSFLGHLAGGKPPKSSVFEGMKNIETIAELRKLAGIK